MKILVTGGLGVVGSCLATRFCEAGHEVRIIDSASAARNWFNRAHVPATVEIEQAALQEASWLEEWVEQSDVVLHAAASTGIPYSVQSPEEDWENNVTATRAVLEVLHRRPRPTVVLSSVKPYGLDHLPVVEMPSRYVLGPGHAGVDEFFPLEPDEPYAASKAAQSMLCMAWARSYNLPIVTLRCSNLYGPAAPHGPRHGWLTWLCISAAIGRPIEIQGTGQQTRDMLYVDDVGTAVQAGWDCMEKVKGQVFNIGGGTGRCISVLEAVTQLRQEVKGSLFVKHGPGRTHEDRLFVTDHAAFTRATGWKPAVSVESGIREVSRWANTHRAALLELYGVGEAACPQPV